LISLGFGNPSSGSRTLVNKNAKPSLAIAWETLGNGAAEAHIFGMATIVQCNCGAEYRRTEEKFLEPHTGDAVCAVCGAALKTWSKATHVPVFELIERPTVKRRPKTASVASQR
jgi:hypothetical protein